MEFWLPADQRAFDTHSQQTNITAVLTEMQDSNSPLVYPSSEGEKATRTVIQTGGGIPRFSDRFHNGHAVQTAFPFTVAVPTSALPNADSTVNHDILVRWKEGMFQISPNKKQANQT
ncbi:MAG TPA: hypothetical protein VIJ80_02775 [Candidatus Cryosericum sp.]